MRWPTVASWQERRWALHAKVVEAIEQRAPDRLAEQIERLAHHALRGELREKAVHYLRQAGLKAKRSWRSLTLGSGLSRRLVSSRRSPRGCAHGSRPSTSALNRGRRRTNSVNPGRAECLRGAETVAERLLDDHRRG